MGLHRSASLRHDVESCTGAQTNSHAKSLCRVFGCTILRQSKSIGEPVCKALSSVTYAFTDFWQSPCINQNSMTNRVDKMNRILGVVLGHVSWNRVGQVLDSALKEPTLGKEIQ